MKKKYVVVDRNEDFDCINFINSNSDFVEGGHTHAPYRLRESSYNAISPKIFENRSEAVKWKNRFQSFANAEWAETGHMAKYYGRRKRKYKVESFTSLDDFKLDFTLLPD